MTIYLKIIINQSSVCYFLCFLSFKYLFIITIIYQILSLFFNLTLNDKDHKWAFKPQKNTVEKLPVNLSDLRFSAVWRWYGEILLFIQETSQTTAAHRAFCSFNGTRLTKCEQIQAEDGAQTGVFSSSSWWKCVRM